MKMNYYAQVIEIFNGIGVEDVRKMLIDIGKHNPKAICDAYHRLPPEKKPAEDWKVRAREILLTTDGSIASGKVAAIKYCRSMTGMTLADSKNAVEALQLS